jgi:hypothetical protein
MDSNANSPPYYFAPISVPERILVSLCAKYVWLLKSASQETKAEYLRLTPISLICPIIFLIARQMRDFVLEDIRRGLSNQSAGEILS